MPLVWAHPKKPCVRGKNRLSAGCAATAWHHHQQHLFFCRHQLIYSKSWWKVCHCNLWVTPLQQDNLRPRICIKWVTIVIYYQSVRGVNEYCGHRHNGAAVTGHSAQLAPPQSGEGLAPADATVGSFRHKVMDTEVWWKKLENSGVPEPIHAP